MKTRRKSRKKARRKSRKKARIQKESQLERDQKCLQICKGNKERKNLQNNTEVYTPVGETWAVNKKSQNNVATLERKGLGKI